MADDRWNRRLALGGLVGPAAFVAAWSIGGLRRAGYSPVDDAISRLAELGAPTRVGMTAGFIAFGVGVPAFALALRDGLPGPAWAAAATTGVATLAVAALPLGGDLDTAHGVAAGIGYASLAAVPLCAAPGLERAGRTRAARWSWAAGAVVAVALAATTLGPAHGLWQRLGLSVGDLWLAVAAVTVVRRGRLVEPDGHHGHAGPLTEGPAAPGSRTV